VFAVDPIGTGGVEVRALAGPVREQWLALLRELLPPSAPVRRIPLNIADGRLLGGLDLAATLRAGRPVAERGLLAEADSGVVLLAMAERLPLATAARLAAVLDTGAVVMERDGVALRSLARFGVIALDEGMTDNEHTPGALLDRLAFCVELSGIGIDDAVGRFSTADAVAAARVRLPTVAVGDQMIKAFCSTAMALGIASIRAPLLALRVARAAAALAGRRTVAHADAEFAGRLVLAPRATVLPEIETPPSEPDTADPAPQESAPDLSRDSTVDGPPATAEGVLDDIVLEAAQAAIPAGLLAQLKAARGGFARSQSAGRAGMPQQSAKRGRPIGALRGEPQAGARLNLLETLRAAAPWQPLRQRAAVGAKSRGGKPMLINVRREDFRITRFKQRAQTTTIFVVDASGSAALHRLAEAKGAVELLLADCYVRRDSVALIAFRGRGADLLLPPTRSLARAKRSLQSLPGGGGTPLAAGLAAAFSLVDAVRRKGETPTLVLLTDGRANIARDGTAGRARAEADALAASRLLRGARIPVLFVDTSLQASAYARRLADEMNARYLALPYAGALQISHAVRASASLPATIALS
jgi:magnesium chelatase subunit D